MGEEEQIDCEDCRKLRTIAFVCVAGSLLMFSVCIVWLYPYVQERSDCANECNKKIAYLMDQCSSMTGVNSNLLFNPEGNLSGVNYPIPAENEWGNPVYVPIEEVIDWNQSS